MSKSFKKLPLQIRVAQKNSILVLKAVNINKTHSNRVLSEFALVINVHSLRIHILN
jgi:hypothetical protein